MQIQQQNVQGGRNVSCHTGGSQCVCDFLLPLQLLHLKETEVHITQHNDVHSLSQALIQVVTDGLQSDCDFLPLLSPIEWDFWERCALHNSAQLSIRLKKNFTAGGSRCVSDFLQRSYCIWIRSIHSTWERCGCTVLVTIVNTGMQWGGGGGWQGGGGGGGGGGGERCSGVHQQVWSLINGAVHPPLDFNAESLIRNWQLRWRHCPNPSAPIFQIMDSILLPAPMKIPSLVESTLLRTADLKSDWGYTQRGIEMDFQYHSNWIEAHLYFFILRSLVSTLCPREVSWLRSNQWISIHQFQHAHKRFGDFKPLEIIQLARTSVSQMKVNWISYVSFKGHNSFKLPLVYARQKLAFLLDRENS